VTAILGFVRNFSAGKKARISALFRRTSPANASKLHGGTDRFLRRSLADRNRSEFNSHTLVPDFFREPLRFFESPYKATMHDAATMNIYRLAWTRGFGATP